jgi:hypothetical protein
MAHCKGNKRGDAMLSMGACYDGKGSGGGGTALSMGAHCKGNGCVGEGAVQLMALLQWQRRGMHCPVDGAF